MRELVSQLRAKVLPSLREECKCILAPPWGGAEACLQAQDDEQGTDGLSQ